MMLYIHSKGSLSAVRRVLKEVLSDVELEVVRIKNRLMLEFDALVTGGYRDLLINVRVKETGHICEIQITLEAMLQIKVSSGHRLYKIARVLNLLEPEVNSHVGGHSVRCLNQIPAEVLI